MSSRHPRSWPPRWTAAPGTGRCSRPGPCSCSCSRPPPRTPGARTAIGTGRSDRRGVSDEPGTVIDGGRHHEHRRRLREDVAVAARQLQQLDLERVGRREHLEVRRVARRPHDLLRIQDVLEGGGAAAAARDPGVLDLVDDVRIHREPIGADQIVLYPRPHPRGRRGPCSRYGSRRSARSARPATCRGAARRGRCSGRRT